MVTGITIGTGLVISLPLLLLFLFLSLVFPIMSIIPLNKPKYKGWTVEQLYYEMYPYLMEDFMDRGGCERVHGAGNMIAGESTVTHVTFQGGTKTFANVKKRQYELYVEEGGRTLDAAQRRGEFTGIARGT